MDTRAPATSAPQADTRTDIETPSHPPGVRARPGLRAGVWGATGATGGEVLRQCVADPRIGEIVAFTRRPLQDDARQQDQVRVVQVADFLDVTPHREDLRSLDVVYWCLGVSQLAEPKADRYRVITRDYAMAVAKVLHEDHREITFHFVSGTGAARNGLSPVMWGRVKGEAEKALAGVGLHRLVVWRPTFIHSVAKREKPTHGDRLAEVLHFRAIPLLTNSTVDIAQGMLHTTFVPDDRRDRTYGPWDIGRLGRAYRKAAQNDQLNGQQDTQDNQDKREP